MTIGEPIDADVLRIRDDFLQVPGLLTSAEAVAARFDVSTRHARVILESMVRERFLERTVDGQYLHKQERSSL